MPRRKKTRLTPGQALALVLRQLRRERGWSQEDLASEVPCDRTSIGRLERAAVSPSLDFMVRIANAFGISYGQLSALVEERCENGNG
jgi:transcriptional regulator with XRE-family HTH domain